MHSVEVQRNSNQYIKIAQKFVALYYRVLNDYPAFLFRFYGADSTVVVCEATDNVPHQTTKAESTETVHQLLHAMYTDVNVTVRNCTPQPSTGGCITLLVTGMMIRFQYHQEVTFTQSLVLSRQKDGYYVKTDTVLLLPVMCASTDKPPRFLGGTSVISTSDVANLEEGAIKTKIHEQDDDHYHIMYKASLLQQKIPHNDVDSCRGMKVDIDMDDGVSHENKKPNMVMMGLTKKMTTDGAEREETCTPFGGNTQLGTNMCTSTISSTRNAEISYPTKVGEAEPHLTESAAAVLVNKNIRSSPVSAPPTLIACPGNSPSKLGPEISRGGQSKSQISSPQHSTSDPAAVATQDKKSFPSLFVCKLPKNTAVEKVTELFAPFGEFAEEEPVRVFEGTNNSYARVCFATDESVQKARSAEIHCEGVKVVTDEWRPREKPFRKRYKQRNMTNENRVTVAATNTATNGN